MARNSLNLVMILGSVRDGRMVARVSSCVINAVKKHTKMSITVVDPLSSPDTCTLNRQPMHYLNPANIPQWMKNLKETITNSKAVMLLSTEYNGMMPPAMMNLMNSLPPPVFRHKPCGIVTYTLGTTGAMRSLNSTRPYASEFGMLVVPGYVPIPLVSDTIDPDGNCNNGLVNANLEKLVKNVEWYAQAIHEYHRNGNAFID